MAVGVSKLIELLNEALRIEYSEVFLYSRRGDTIQKNKINKEIYETFERFCRMEVRHADNIAMQIQILGGKPVWEFIPFDVKESLDEMLLDSLKREKKAVEVYNSLIDIIETDKEDRDQLKLILKGIKSEEEYHVKVIEDFIKKIKER